MLFLGTFITISSGDLTGMITDYVSPLLADLTPLLLIIVGVGVGLIIFYAIMKSIRG